tara:strand:- start:19777 stop:20547 length:771 start_codon:yes stop_codon:yes gene_type:complete
MSQTICYRTLNKKPVFALVGLINIAIFSYAIFRLWFFLLYMQPRVVLHNDTYKILSNLLLVAFFIIPHSLLLRAKTKVFLYRYIPKGLYYSFYSLHASLAIILLDTYWQSSNFHLYSLKGHQESFFLIFYGLSWLFMFWAMVAVGLGKQNGVEDWLRSLQNKKLQHRMPRHGPFLITRHPIYIGFLGMIWTTPYMSLDHLFLSIVWSSYILYGIARKEKILSTNKKYIEYTHKVPVFPFSKVSIDNFIFQKIGRYI